MDKNSCGATRKICVIACAGAEVPYDIEDGLNFAKKTTGIMDGNTCKDIEQMNMAIKEHYNCCLAEVSDDKKIWYPDNHCNTNLQIQQLLKAAIIDKRVENIEESTNKQNQRKIGAELIKKYSDNYKRKNRNPDIDFEMNELLKRHISYKGIFDKEFPLVTTPLLCMQMAPSMILVVLLTMVRMPFAPLYGSILNLDSSNQSEAMDYLICQR